MDDLLSELLNVVDSGHYSIALFTSLALPDICAAMESEDGKATGAKYKTWFDKWVAPKYPSYPNEGISLSGQTCYAYRCGLLHQGKAMHKDLGYSRILFLGPGPLLFHNTVMNDALTIDIPTFVRDIASSVREWMRSVEGLAPFKEHYKLFMKRHRGGLAPYITGLDVYS
ncbi:hypothetical protein HV782_013640 [Pseudomonas monsensis]|uniref:hypothetical protein n=1 Tax=Pseudomonas monsensis TaxID=2745509 RepID=UPI001644BEF7|nr:hypothetical protein [Pseudomonas monsensis]QXI02968.1 hypothetical protein HV782_013640 [Pseudomonas monsensis]